ncbi:MAG TPA: hypothetical protein VNI77_11020 [Nitrososphaera sp.]|nr:hypothetical protein [Nitrososphaera sp.]
MSLIRCPKCGKWGHLTVKKVKSYHYGYVGIYKFPHGGSEVVDVLRPQSLARAKELGIVTDWSTKDERCPYRLKKTYGPWTYPYVRHYDPEKYQRNMTAYREGKLKARPNGLRWCKLRTIRRPGEALSEWERAADAALVRDIHELEKESKFNAWIMRLKRYVKMTQKYKSLHPIFDFVPIVVAEPRYSL